MTAGVPESIMLLSCARGGRKETKEGDTIRKAGYAEVGKKRSDMQWRDAAGRGRAFRAA
jgi:hypothetical protein